MWIGEAFHWPKGDPWRHFYNASRLHEMVSLTGTSKATPQTTTTPEALAAEGSNLVQDKGKRNIVDK